MIDEHTLQAVVQRLVVTANPSRIILFGSYGRGDADEASDVDIVVIKPEVQEPYEEMVRLRQLLGPVGTGMDVLVYSEAMVEERKNWCTSPIYWALREGKTLYAAA